MDIYLLISAMRDSISDSADLGSWCQGAYGKLHSVFIGTDKRNQPGQDKYPLVGLFPAIKKAGLDETEVLQEIDVVCGVYQDKTLTGSKANVTEMQGISEIETFRKKVEAAITAAVSAPQRVQVLDIAYNPIEFFPYFLAGMTVKVVEPLYMGSDSFE